MVILEIEVIYLMMLIYFIKLLKENKRVGIIVVVYGNSMVSLMVEVVIELLGSILIVVVDMLFFVLFLDIIECVVEKMK